MSEIYNKLKQLLDSLIEKIEGRKKEVLELEKKLTEIKKAIEKVENSLSFWVSLSKEEKEELIAEVVSKIETSEFFINSIIKEKLRQLEEIVKNQSSKRIEKLEKLIGELKEEIKKLDKPSTAFVPVGSKSYVDVFNALDEKVGTSDRLKFLNSNLSFDATTKTVVIEPRGTIMGTIASGQVAFGTAVNTIGGDPTFTFDGATKKLGVSALKIGTLSGVLKATAGDVSGGATTSDLPEGTNLYFTNARARSSISANAPITYNSTTGVIGLSTPLAISYGGTGLSSLGTANQILGVNSGATGLQYRNITSLLSAGSGISITGTSTATISNTGVLSLNSLTGSLTLQGTTNQINVSSGGSTITLSTPQNIAPTSTPTFGGLTLNGNLNLKGNQILNANYIIKFKKVTTSPYTLVLTDSQNVCLQMDTIGDNTVIIPTDASVPFPIGTKIMIQKYGLGITTIQGASGVIVRDPFFSWVIKDDYNIVEIIKMGTNDWVIKY
ncbi:MAG: hypothetical protein KatS3mg096_735 [Candidatus Parcubacteria bacterium]|nr:MAG: hypothetical protein KatS3mg096_735 [Candidatus Parcubacteria bacterium]